MATRKSQYGKLAKTMARQQDEMVRHIFRAIRQPDRKKVRPITVPPPKVAKDGTRTWSF